MPKLKARLREYNTFLLLFFLCAEKSDERKKQNEGCLYFYSFRLNDEWIPMDSSRLRIPSQMGKTTEASAQFKEGEKVLARWTDSRKFPGTVNRVLENSMFTFQCVSIIFC